MEYVQLVVETSLEKLQNRVLVMKAKSVVYMANIPMYMVNV